MPITAPGRDIRADPLVGTWAAAVNAAYLADRGMNADTLVASF